MVVRARPRYALLASLVGAIGMAVAGCGDGSMTEDDGGSAGTTASAGTGGSAAGRGGTTGEPGSLTAGSSATAFFNDLETRQIPSLAWDFDPFSNCSPDLLNITQSATSLTPSAWGMIVQPYLLAHAP